MKFVTWKVLLGLACLFVVFLIWHEILPFSQPISADSNSVADSSSSEFASAVRTPARQLRNEALIEGLLKGGMDETEPDRVNQRVQAALPLISDSDLIAVLEALTVETGSFGSLLRNLLVRRWAAADPSAAAEWALQRLESNALEGALAQISFAWASLDLPAAVLWFNALQNPKLRDEGLLNLSYETCRMNPKMALDLASDLSLGTKGEELMVHAIRQWTSVDAASAVDWAQKQNDQALRERLLAAIAPVLAQWDGVAAATLAANSIRAGSEQDRTVVEIVQQWVRRAPEQTASWVESFPEIPVRRAAVQSLVSGWEASDRAGLMDWINGLSDGSLGDLVDSCTQPSSQASLSRTPTANCPITR